MHKASEQKENTDKTPKEEQALLVLLVHSGHYWAASS